MYPNMRQGVREVLGLKNGNMQPGLSKLLYCIVQTILRTSELSSVHATL